MLIDTENKNGSITLEVDGDKIEFTSDELACMGIDADQFRELLSASESIRQ